MKKNTKRAIALTIMASAITLTGMNTASASTIQFENVKVNSSQFIDWNKPHTQYSDPELAINTNLNPIDPSWGVMNKNGDIIVDWAARKYPNQQVKPKPEVVKPEIEENKGNVIVKENENVYVANDNDFRFVQLNSWDWRYKFAYPGPNDVMGIFTYQGENQEVIEIPSVIAGIEISSYAGMFSYFEGLDKIKVISNNENITSTDSMFYGAKISKIDLSDFNADSVTNMKDMFARSTVEEITFGKWDMSNVKNMNGMFQSASNLFNLDLSPWSEINSEATLVNVLKNTYSDKVRTVTAKRKNITQLIKNYEGDNGSIYFLNK